MLDFLQHEHLCAALVAILCVRNTRFTALTVEHIASHEHMRAAERSVSICADTGTDARKLKNRSVSNDRELECDDNDDGFAAAVAVFTVLVRNKTSIGCE